MDRHLRANTPGEVVRLSVGASHPEHGAYFSAELGLRRAAQPFARSEEAGLATLLQYALALPHDSYASLRHLRTAVSGVHSALPYRQEALFRRSSPLSK